MINTMGATPVHQPQNMPRNQRAALFADPDGIYMKFSQRLFRSQLYINMY